MFNLIMTNQDLGNGPLTIKSDRIFEYTRNDIVAAYTNANRPKFDDLIKIPCLFMKEGIADELAYVGKITAVNSDDKNTIIQYFIDQGIRPVPNKWIYEKRSAFGMVDTFEFSRHHWAIKDTDLFRMLLIKSYSIRQRPKVFNIPEAEVINNKLLSVMMPFDEAFKSVYQSISEYARINGFECYRADDIWKSDAIIQDIINLIDRSRIVICDCSGRNSNVFYEAGVSHALGRDVILITQNTEDIPFNLRHLRYIRYLKNPQGLEGLISEIGSRIRTLVEQ